MPPLWIGVELLERVAAPLETIERVVTGPILRTGIATCASCGGVTLRTDKTGCHRHYACSTCARAGESACDGGPIPMG
jgi:site-specific DNA recombinase